MDDDHSERPATIRNEASREDKFIVWGDQAQRLGLKRDVSEMKCVICGDMMYRDGTPNKTGYGWEYCHIYGILRDKEGYQTPIEHHYYSNVRPLCRNCNRGEGGQHRLHMTYYLRRGSSRRGKEKTPVDSAIKLLDLPDAPFPICLIHRKKMRPDENNYKSDSIKCDACGLEKLRDPGFFLCGCLKGCQERCRHKKCNRKRCMDCWLPKMSTPQVKGIPGAAAAASTGSMDTQSTEIMRVLPPEGTFATGDLLILDCPSVHEHATRRKCMRCRNLTAICGTSYCWNHKCTGPNCTKEASVPGSKCSGACRSGLPESRITREELILQKCERDNCTYRKNKGSNYCAIHTCSLIGCIKDKSGIRHYCNQHVCSNSECEGLGWNVSRDNTRVCDECMSKGIEEKERKIMDISQKLFKYEIKEGNEILSEFGIFCLSGWDSCSSVFEFIRKIVQHREARFKENLDTIQNQLTIMFEEQHSPVPHDEPLEFQNSSRSASPEK